MLPVIIFSLIVMTILVIGIKNWRYDSCSSDVSDQRCMLKARCCQLILEPGVRIGKKRVVLHKGIKYTDMVIRIKKSSIEEICGESFNSYNSNKNSKLLTKDYIKKHPTLFDPSKKYITLRVLVDYLEEFGEA